MKNESKTERQLVQELIELRRQVAEMEKIEGERKRTEEALRESEKRYREVVESATEIIHTTDLRGNFTFANTATLKTAGTSLEEFKQLSYLQIIHPDHRQRLSEIYINQFRERKATIYVEFPILSRSGEVIWLGQNSSLMFEGGKIVGFHSVARDITELKKMEETLRRSEEEAKRLAQENAVVADIGKIVSSTLDINEVYERFAVEVQKIIPFDRIAINIINPEDSTVIVSYTTGDDIIVLRPGSTYPLAASMAEVVKRTRSTLCIEVVDQEATGKQYPVLLPTIQAGFRSLMAVPLLSKDEVIGTLNFRTKKPNVYSEEIRKLAERVSNQIAGAMANAQLFAERKQAEEAARRSEEGAKRLAQENAIMAKIGQIISSTLKIEEVYEGFAQEMRKLIDFDRLAVNIIDPDGQTLTIPYFSGRQVPGRRKDDVLPLAGTPTEEVVRTGLSLFIQGKSQEEITSRFPRLSLNFKAGLRSFILIPLISESKVIGVLYIQSARENAYTEKDLRLAERVGNQIAGAVANAQLYMERMEAEEAARRSEEEAKRLAQENALVAEIGRIIGLSLNIDEVFERFSKAVTKLIPFDRIVINLRGLQEDDSFVRYVAGIDVPNRRAGEYVPLAGTATAECMRTRSSLLIQPKDVKEIEEWVARFPKFLPNFEAGIRSAILVPLIAGDQIIGVLSLRTTKTQAYTDQDVRLTESIASQIAGVVANAQLYIERTQAEAAARRSEETAQQLAKENEVIAEIGRIISSTTDIEDIYERFAEQTRQLIAFDYICISTVNREKGTLHIPYVSGYVIPGRMRTDMVSLAGSFAEEATRTRSGQLIQTKDAEEVAARFPGLLPFLQHGFRSFMAIPLISNDQVIGVLCVYSIKSKAYKEAEVNLAEQIADQIAGAIANAQLFAERKQAEKEREKLIGDLQKTLSEVKTLKGIFPICASCKKIRDDKGYWRQIEAYIRDHSEAEFSHGICPDCMKKLYPDFYKEDK